MRLPCPFIGQVTGQSQYIQQGVGRYIKTQETFSTWHARNPSGRDFSLIDRNQSTGLIYHAPFRPYARTVTQDNYDPNDGTQLSKKTTNTSVDNYANPLDITVDLRDYINNTTWRTKTDNTFEPDSKKVPALGDRGFTDLGRLGHTKVEHQKNGGGTLTKESLFYYHNTLGTLRASIREPHKTSGTIYHQSQYLRTDYERDSRGLISRTLLTGKNYDLEDTKRETRQSTSYVIINHHHAKQVEKRNALGQVSTTWTSMVHGGVLKVRDINGLISTTTYDSFGRKIRSDAPDDNYSEITRTLLHGDTCSGKGPTLYGHKEVLKTAVGGYAARTTRCFDLAGNERVSLGYGFSIAEPINTFTAYDSLGRVIDVTTKHPNAEVTLYTLTNYDRAGRVVRVRTSKDNNEIFTQYKHYDVLQGTRNALGSPTYRNKWQRVNAKGEVLRVIDNKDIGGNTQPTVNYTYDALSRLTQVEAPTGVTQYAYDLVGRKVNSKNPHEDTYPGSSKWGWNYRYNAFGDLEYQKNPTGKSIRIKYDALGRIKWRSEEGGKATHWYYDSHKYSTSGARKGQLLYVVGPNHSRLMRYDHLGRQTLVRNDVIDYLSGQKRISRFDTKFTYDNLSRVDKQTSPSGIVVRRGYTTTGRVDKLTNGGGSARYWDVRRSSIKERFVRLAYKKDKSYIRVKELFDIGEHNKSGRPTGRPTELWWTAHRSSGAFARDPFIRESYKWDEARGNLKERKDERSGNYESYTYDKLDRMTSSTAHWKGLQKAEHYEYDHGGNITKRDGKRYDYSSSKGRARLHKDGSYTYQYDRAGHYTGGAGFTASWNDFGKPKEFYEKNRKDPVTGKTGSRTRFYYDESRMRVLQDSPTKTIRYVDAGQTSGMHFEHITDKKTGKVIQRTYIYAEGRAIARYDLNGSGSTSGLDGTALQYFMHDYLGSVRGVLSVHHGFTGGYNFDAWGMRRLASNPSHKVSYPSAVYTRYTQHGFTGHEQLDHIREGLVHMNGRIYHPKLGRFLSPDPVTQFPHSSQGWAKYTYVHNNPLLYTDPSGYRMRGADIARLAAAIGTAAVFGPTAAAIYAGFKAEFGISLVATGDIQAATKSALLASATAIVANQVGTFARANKFYGTIAHHTLHGLSQGLLNAAFGGNFKSSFRSAFFSSLAAPLVPKNRVGATIVQAIIGGTVSKLSGGKFANGAITAAMVQLFNKFGHASTAGTAPAPIDLGDLGGKVLDGIRWIGKRLFGAILFVASIPSSTQHTHRGRIQAQGGGLEASVAWAQPTPPTVAEGIAMVEALKAQLKPKEVKARAAGFQKAQRFIRNAGKAGGVSAPVSRSFLTQDTKDIRVDIEVITGEAFIP